MVGETVPSIDKYLLPAIFVIIALSAIPVLLEVRKARRESAAAAATPRPRTGPWRRNFWPTPRSWRST